MSSEGKRVLHEAYEELESELPDWLARVVHWIRAPERWWLRISLGVVFIAGGMLWFLPVVGLEMIPLGLMFLAQDIPFLQKPVGRAILWCVEKYRALCVWWKRRQARKRAAG